MPTDKPRLCITVSETLFDEIRQYQTDGNFTTNSRAVIDLIRKGIADIKEEDRMLGKSTTPALSSDALLIAQYYDALPKRKKKVVADLVSSLVEDLPKRKKPPSK